MVTMNSREACVWSTNKDCWDSFLNDPELARALEQVRLEQSQSSHCENGDLQNGKSGIAASETCEKEEPSGIDERIRAYETPITDEILRQSIR